MQDGSIQELESFLKLIDLENKYALRRIDQDRYELSNPYGEIESIIVMYILENFILDYANSEASFLVFRERRVEMAGREKVIA